LNGRRVSSRNDKSLIELGMYEAMSRMTRCVVVCCDCDEKEGSCDDDMCESVVDDDDDADEDLKLFVFELSPNHIQNHIQKSHLES